MFGNKIDLQISNYIFDGGIKLVSSIVEIFFKQYNFHRNQKCDLNINTVPKIKHIANAAIVSNHLEHAPF